MFAYLLLTHKNPSSVEELAARILDLSPDACIVVHHDADAAEAPWQGSPKDPIHLVERSKVLWGDWSMVVATLRMIEFAFERSGADWVVLLSGEHRPLVDLHNWELALADSGLDALVHAQRLPYRLRYGSRNLELNKYLARTRHHWTTMRRPRHALAHRAVGELAKFGALFRPLFSLEFAHRRDAWAVGTHRRARSATRMPVYRGSQWFALNRKAGKAILAADPSTAAWYEQSWIPDESYFPTLLHATSGIAIGNEATTFVLDTPERPTPGWMRLGMHHLPDMWASGAPFARKVDPFEQPDVARAIDDVVDGRRSPTTSKVDDVTVRQDL